MTNLYIMLYTSLWSRFDLTTSVVIGTDCIGSCKSKYHTIMATMAPEASCEVVSYCHHFVSLIVFFVLLSMLSITELIF